MDAKKRRFFLVIWSIIMATFLTFSSVFAQEAMNSIIEGAKKEGKLVWYYAGAIETAYEIINKFKMKYPFIDAQFIKGTRPEITARLEMETKLQKHIADVLLLGGSEIHLFKKKASGSFENKNGSSFWEGTKPGPCTDCWMSRSRHG